MDTDFKNRRVVLSAAMLLLFVLSNYRFSWFAKGPTGYEQKTIINQCTYQVTFVGYLPSEPNYYDWETILIIVNRPANLRRVCDFWLTEEEGADLNYDGRVNFIDYAIITGAKQR